MARKEFNSYTYGEARTAGDQYVRFTCATEDRDRVAEFLGEHVRSIHRNIPHKSNVDHGSYGMYSRYNLKQHKYAGGGHGACGGYIEVLEILDVPEGRHPIVIHEYQVSRGHVFTEWKTIEEAVAAFEANWGNRDTAEAFVKLPGFIRRIPCGPCTPWFYAMDDEELIRDFAVPCGVADDPVFRFGRYFIVHNYGAMPQVKICFGCQHRTERASSYPHKETTRRVVFWDDGTIWDENSLSGGRPVPMDNDQMWIVDAMAQFRELLAGARTSGEVKFRDGSKVAFRHVPADRRKPDSEGRYYLEVQVEGEKNKQEGWVDFSPTTKHPTVASMVEYKLGKRNKKLLNLKITKKEGKQGGRKWHGVFHKTPLAETA